MRFCNDFESWCWFWIWMGFRPFSDCLNNTCCHRTAEVLQSFSFGIMTNVFKCSSLQRTNIHAPLRACLTSTIRPTFRCVPVNKGVYQRPAFAIVGGSQLQPISLQSTDHVAFPGNTHGECPLVVLTSQRVQRSTARSPWVEEDQQPQIWKEKEQKYDSFYHFSLKNNIKYKVQGWNLLDHLTV